VRCGIRLELKKPSVLITAGPTREEIDPVRFISNYSTGTFGYEIAGEAVRRGFKVILISGPTGLCPPRGVKTISVETAAGMRRAVMANARECGYVIMTAAVSDWRALKKSARKIKKSSGRRMLLELEANPDILAELGRHKKYVLAGFALETERLEKNALGKLRSKNLDLIVANKLTRKAALFGDKKIDILIMDRLGNKAFFRRKTKRALAKIVLDKVFNFKI